MHVIIVIFKDLGKSVNCLLLRLFIKSHYILLAVMVFICIIVDCIKYCLAIIAENYLTYGFHYYVTHERYYKLLLYFRT